MKKILSMLLIVGLVFVFGACESNSSGDSGDNKDKEVVENEVAESEDVKSEDVKSEDIKSGNRLELVSRGTWNNEDANGYTVQGEIETTDLIKASDWKTVESTYNSLNPSEPLPSFDVVSPDGANQDTSTVLIGRIKLTNTTDGWNFSENSPYKCNLYLDAYDLNGSNSSKLCVMFGNGMKQYAFGGAQGCLDAQAVMKSDNWSVLFVVAVPEVFTPNEPNGCEKVLNATFKAGGFYGRGGCEFMMPNLVE